MVERRECPEGMRVCITGGIYKKHGYGGEIAGSTRCMVDVFVPELKRVLRVRRTSVESVNAEAEETTTEDPPLRRQPSVAEVLARDELLRTSLAKSGSLEDGDAGFERANESAGRAPKVPN
jgi:hypothetical protein